LKMTQQTENYTKFRKAINSRNIVVARGLLEVDESLLTQVDPRNGWTVLHLACLKSAEDVCEMLVEKGMDINKVAKGVKKLPLTPMGIAMSKGCRMVSVLLKRDCDKLSEFYGKKITMGTCSICETDNILYPLLCGHSFCVPCLVSWLNSCPQPICPHKGCLVEIHQTDLKYILPDELFQSIMKKQLVSALVKMQDFVWCVRCKSGGFVRKVDPNDPCPFLGCTTCKFDFCIQCGRSAHLGMTCDDYLVVYQGMEVLKSQTWIVRNAKRCPYCEVSIEKNGGCRRMSCSRCTCPFCWQCLKALQVWSPPSTAPAPLGIPPLPEPISFPEDTNTTTTQTQITTTQTQTQTTTEQAQTQAQTPTEQTQTQTTTQQTQTQTTTTTSEQTQTQTTTSEQTQTQITTEQTQTQAQILEPPSVKVLAVCTCTN